MSTTMDVEERRRILEEKKRIRNEKLAANSKERMAKIQSTTVDGVDLPPEYHERAREKERTVQKDDSKNNSNNDLAMPANLEEFQNMLSQGNPLMSMLFKNANNQLANGAENKKVKTLMLMFKIIHSAVIVFFGVMSFLSRSKETCSIPFKPIDKFVNSDNNNSMGLKVFLGMEIFALVTLTALLRDFKIAFKYVASIKTRLLMLLIVWFFMCILCYLSG